MLLSSVAVTGAEEEVIFKFDAGINKGLIRKTDGIVTVELRAEDPGWVSELTGNRKENHATGYGSVLAVFEDENCRFYQTGEHQFFECYEDDDINLVDIYYQNTSGPDVAAHQILRVQKQRVWFELSGQIRQNEFQMSKKISLDVWLKGETFMRHAEIEM